MLSVSVHKDIVEYTEKIVGKMSTRTLVCVTGGLLASVAAAATCYLGFGIQVSNATLPVMACSMPFWLAGFWRPKQMKIERFIPLYLEHVKSNCVLSYSPSFLLYEPELTGRIACKPDKRSAQRARKKGAELYEPTKKEG